ncbi:MAG: ComEC/Rec2 family competence protein [Chitinophagaceae bacterium]
MPVVLPAWKKAPFLRLLFPFFAGILLQWISNPSIVTGWLLVIFGVISGWLFTQLSIKHQFQYAWLKGIPVHILLLSAGMLLAFYKNPLNHGQSIVQAYHPGDTLLVKLGEPLSVKDRSFKTTASVQILSGHTLSGKLSGNIILYFSKDSLNAALRYGHQLLLTKPLQPVSYSGNPGSFNYRRYCALNNIYFQVYLDQHDYSIAGYKAGNQQWLYRLRDHLLGVIKKYIPGDREAGLAEALLIGYKDDVDKDLVQSYSNTGVVHVIAISGLHLGLIYLLLCWLCKPLEKTKWSRWLQPVVLLAGLWIFTLLACASPSVVRSAVMFTCIITGNSLSRSISVYNSLAASAFLLLCYNPYWLADTGFQLSYAALLGIVLFMRPIYHCISFNNRWIDHIWKACAITLAAQVLTAPLIIYYFHQFPLLFLFANLLAVPLSSCILVAEIVLCVVAPWPVAANLVGVITGWLIKIMNGCVAFFDHLPATVLKALQVNMLQVILLYTCIAAIAWWYTYNRKKGLLIALGCLLGIIVTRSFFILNTARQQKLVVYNIPRHSAIDFITGNQYYFVGDSAFSRNTALQQFYLSPSRTLHRTVPSNSINYLSGHFPLFRFGNRTILIVTKDLKPSLYPPAQPIPVDLVIFSGNPAIGLSQLLKLISFRQLVIDNSNSAFKTARWKQECAILAINCFNVSEQGAFVLNLY